MFQCKSSILCILIFLAIIPFTGICASAQDSDDILRDGIIIAYYDNKPITYADIRISTKTIQELIKKGWSKTRLRDWQKEVEFRALIHKIEELIVSDAEKKYEVELTDEEIDLRVADKITAYYGKRHLTEKDAKKQNETIESMIILLYTWIDDHEKGEELYRGEFSKKIKRKNWELAKKRYATKQAVDLLKSQLRTVDAKSIESKFRDIAIKELKREKLLQRLKEARELRAENDYIDWLYTKLSAVIIKRGDILPYREKSGANYNFPPKKQMDIKLYDSEDSGIPPNSE